MDTQRIVEEVVKRLEDDLAESITRHIKDSLQAVIREEFKFLHKKIDTLERTLSTLSQDTGDDRKDFGHMKVSLASIDQSLKELLDMNSRQTKTIVNKMKDEVEKVGETISNEVPIKAKEGVQGYIEQIKPRVVQLVKQPSRRFLFWRR